MDSKKDEEEVNACSGMIDFGQDKNFVRDVY